MRPWWSSGWANWGFLFCCRWGSVRSRATGVTGPTYTVVTCDSPRFDASSGNVICRDGYRHRLAAVTCAVTGESDGAGGANQDDAKPRADGSVGCEESSECRAFDLGYCDSSSSPGKCRSGCRTDDECGSGVVCHCRGPSPSGGVCVPSNCRVTTDCEPGALCGARDRECAGDGFACQVSRPRCSDSTQCASGQSCKAPDCVRVDCSEPS